MSKLGALRGQLKLVEERDPPPTLPRLGLAAMLLLLLVAAVVCAAAMHVLPTYSADDVGSIMFRAG